MHHHPDPNSTPAADGLEVVNTTGVLTGNADIVCERGEPQPDTVACTLPMYPQPGDLPPDPPAHLSTPRTESERVARTMAPLDALAVQASRVVAEARADFPGAFEVRRDRRVGDRRPAGDEWLGADAMPAPVRDRETQPALAPLESRRSTALRTLAAGAAAALVWALIFSCGVAVALQMPGGWDHAVAMLGALSASAVSWDVFHQVRAMRSGGDA
jgi:hypothetical protein